MDLVRSGVTDLDSETRAALVSRIHDSSCRLVMHITGGGMAAITDLLVVGGASRTVLDVTVPYSPAAMADIIGDLDASAVSAPTALALSEAALHRAQALAGDLRRPGASDADADAVIGVGCTAALVTDRTRRGPDAAHIATATAQGTAQWVVGSQTLAGDLGRSQQDRLVANAIIAAIDTACTGLANR